MAFWSPIDRDPQTSDIEKQHIIAEFKSIFTIIFVFTMCGCCLFNVHLIPLSCFFCLCACLVPKVLLHPSRGCCLYRPEPTSAGPALVKYHFLYNISLNMSYTCSYIIYNTIKYEYTCVLIFLFIFCQQEPCKWKCRHYKCTNICSDYCNRPPCYEPCRLLLKCLHKCVGFCGEPCPPLCRVCDEDELTAIVFGNEDEPNARYVICNLCMDLVLNSLKCSY